MILTPDLPWDNWDQTTTTSLDLLPSARKTVCRPTRILTTVTDCYMRNILGT